jgi:GAF domain-containing protein
MSSDAASASALAAAARAIVRQRTYEETLEAIARTARETLPGFDHVGISILTRGGDIETKAATDPLVWELDGLQYSVDEGPCLAAVRESPVVVVNDIRHEQRWPRYLPAAIESGLRSQMAVRLSVDDEATLGGLNLYSTARVGIEPEVQELATSFASHAAVAVHQAREIANLKDALASRKVIGQAIGIVMERYQLKEDRAFAFLVRASSHRNVKLRDIAQELVDETSGR